MSYPWRRLKTREQTNRPSDDHSRAHRNGATRDGARRRRRGDAVLCHRHRSCHCVGERIAFDTLDAPPLVGALAASTRRVWLVTTVVAPQCCARECIHRSEERGRTFRKLLVHSQLCDLTAQPLQLGPLTRIDRRRRVIHPRPLNGHPPTQQLDRHAVRPIETVAVIHPFRRGVSVGTSSSARWSANPTSTLMRSNSDTSGTVHCLAGWLRIEHGYLDDMFGEYRIRRMWASVLAGAIVRTYEFALAFRWMNRPRSGRAVRLLACAAVSFEEAAVSFEEARCNFPG